MIIWMAAGAYGIATLFFFFCLAHRRERMVSAARVVLVLAALVQLAAVGQLCAHGLHPVRDTAGVLNLISLMLVIGWRVTVLRWPRLAILGAGVAPLAFILVLAASQVLPTPGAEPEVGISLLGKTHIVLISLGVACFALAAAVAVLYLTQETALRERRLGRLFRRTPPLTTLDRVGHQLIKLGFPIYTLAIAVGALWSRQLSPKPHVRVEHAISGLIWIVYAGLIVVRWRGGLRGRQAAWLTVGGFFAIVVVLGFYVVRRLIG